MSTELWLVVAATALVTALIKGFGPVTVGGRELPAWSAGVIACWRRRCSPRSSPSRR